MDLQLSLAVNDILPPTADEAKTQQPFRFLDLPLELRLVIYECLFRTRNGYKLPNLSILRTSKQIHTEADQIVRQILRQQDIVVKLGGIEEYGVPKPNWDTRTAHEWRKTILRFRSVTLKFQLNLNYFGYYDLLMPPPQHQIRKIAASLSDWKTWPANHIIRLEIAYASWSSKQARLAGCEDVSKALQHLGGNKFEHYLCSDPVEQLINVGLLKRPMPGKRE